MMKPERLVVGVVMARQSLASKWVSFKWEARGVVASDAVAPGRRVLIADAFARQVLFDGCAMELYRDEAEGYYLNLNAPQPRVFVMWRMRGEEPQPHTVTVSYHEAARLLDAGEQVDAVAMPDAIAQWVARFVERHYRPEPKKVRKRDNRAGMAR
ncbi:MAG: DUF3305 domain-containing protein [Betaproteobacteria bacterium]